MTISELIPRILIERDSFLNITEESLQEEIHNEGNEADSLIEGNDGELEEDPIETFQKQKNDLSKNINTALNETSLSLDFVSLLISSVKPNLAKSTISPHLTKNVPLGSLNSDRLINEEDEKLNEGSRSNFDLGVGWKLQSLNKITTLFRSSSESLNEQVLKERKYWNQINLVVSNNELLFKLRDPINNVKSIGVKYGYGDSGSNFHDKGLGILRKNDTSGDIKFIPLTNHNKINSKIYKYIKIKILSKIDDDFMLTGQSTFDKNFDSNLINDIEKARYFLFEEDLFFQLTREAKSLINYNVSIISNKIIIEINNEIIEIESVVYDESNDDILKNYYQNINTYSSLNNERCFLILKYLKIMLCCYYKYNLKLKQKIPTSLTKWKQSNSHPLILRPMLGNIRHELNLQNMQKILDNLKQQFSEVDFKIDVEKFKNLKRTSNNPFQKSIEKPLSTFTVIMKYRKVCLQVKLAVTSNEIFVNLIVKLDIVKFGVDDLEANSNGLNVMLVEFNEFTGLGESLEWVIRSQLTSNWYKLLGEKFLSED